MLETRLLNSKDLQATSILFDEYRQFYGQNSDLNASQEFLSQRIEKTRLFPNWCIREY